MGKAVSGAGSGAFVVVVVVGGEGAARVVVVVGGAGELPPNVLFGAAEVVVVVGDGVVVDVVPDVPLRDGVVEVVFLLKELLLLFRAAPAPFLDFLPVVVLLTTVLTTCATGKLGEM